MSTRSLVLVAVLIIAPANDLDARTETFRPLTYIPGTAAVKVDRAAVRAKASEKSKLIGYVPGAVRVSVDTAREDDGWVPVDVGWSYRGETWIRRSDIALASDYVPFRGVWPTEFVIYVTEAGDYVHVFRKTNQCPETLPKDVIDRVQAVSREERKKAIPPDLVPIVGPVVPIAVENIRCEELWYVPGTNLLYANPDGEEMDFWFDQRTGEVLINSIADHFVYGYFDGRVEKKDNSCVSGVSIACRISSDTMPNRSKSRPSGQ
jgi:hypothetical protein